ncbi:MAG: NAD(P)H-dependent oxidoreductase subunit E, partial [Rhodoferax sp.]
MNPNALDLESLLERHARAPHRLVQILREIQAQQLWLSRDTLSAVASALHLSLAHVEGVAGFYRFFHSEPVGQYRVLFSDNITDRMQGSQEMLRHLCHVLKVEPHTMRADGRVSVSTTSCTGMRDQGPAALINHHQLVTRLSPGRIEHMAALIEAQVPATQWPGEWSRVDDQIRLANVKLGLQPAPGHGIAAALARGPQAMLDDLKRSKL